MTKDLFKGLWLVLLVAVAADRSFALQGEIATDFAPSGALVSIGGPDSALLQEETTRITTQAVVTDRRQIGRHLSLGGTAWLLLDSLPTYDPTDVPPARIDFSSRLLQLDLTWQIIPGELIWETGKQIIHPSSGFFRQPLDLISRGAAGNVPIQVPGAAAMWEEGWIGTKLDWLVGDFTVENFFSPRLSWSSEANNGLQYLSARQPDWIDQSRLDLHLGTVDVQLLGLLSTAATSAADSALSFSGGAGVDASIGQNLTLHSEISATNLQDRLNVVDPASLTTVIQAMHWAPHALAGFTWSFTPDLSLMAEYYYNGSGFFGNNYTSVLQYAQNRRSSESSAPDLLGQFGSFDAGRNYSFIRLADNLTQKLSVQGWSEINLQDGSGMYGGSLSVLNDNWGLTGSVMNTWGKNDTEAGLMTQLWQFDLEAQVYF